jgi:hypothetical protein
VESVAVIHCLDACAVIAYLLITTEHHKFESIEQQGHFQFLWLR